MRTKMLLLTAALGAAGIATCMAEVYSVNAVGYVNVTLPAGWALIANPLNTTDNKLSTVIPTAPEGTVLYKFDAASQTYLPNATFGFGAWDIDYVLAPGEGAFLNTPDPTTLTFVGEVPQGTLNTPLFANFQLVASQVPQAGGVTTLLGLNADEGDVVYQWDRAGQTYMNSATFAFGAWDVEPSLQVAESMWLQRSAGGSWTRTFSVNP